MCAFCRGSEMKSSTATFAATLESSTIVVKNVPCTECVQCGEKYYSDDVMQNLEKIVEAARKLKSKVFVTEYNVA